MFLKINEINELVNKEFRNNKAYFADEIGINRSYLTDVLNGKKKNDSPKICNALIRFCENKNIDYRKYIFLSDMSEYTDKAE